MDFLTALGLDCGEPMTVGDKWVERIIDLPDPQVEAVMVRLPAGADALELVKFHAPGAESSTDSAPPNRLGMRHLAFRVDDLHGVVDYMRTASWDTVGEIVDYDGVFLLCYPRGPDGLIFELAEQLR